MSSSYVVERDKPEKLKSEFFRPFARYCESQYHSQLHGLCALKLFQSVVLEITGDHDLKLSLLKKSICRRVSKETKSTGEFKNSIGWFRIYIHCGSGFLHYPRVFKCLSCFITVQYTALFDLASRTYARVEPINFNLIAANVDYWLRTWKRVWNWRICISNHRLNFRIFTIHVTFRSKRSVTEFKEDPY